MKILITLVSAFAISSAGVALAGEITGTGKPTGRSGKSACSFSGLEDFDFGAAVDPGVVQNFGRHPSVGAGIGVSDNPSSNNPSNFDGPAAPGRACNPGFPGSEPS